MSKQKLKNVFQQLLSFLTKAMALFCIVLISLFLIASIDFEIHISTKERKPIMDTIHKQIGEAGTDMASKALGLIF